MTRSSLILATLIWGLGALAASAQPSAEKILPLDAKIAEDGRSIELSWFDAKPPRVGSVTVKRRLYGQMGGQSWKAIASALGPVMRYRDDTIVPGVAYEYQVLRTARDIVDVGYWLGGTKVPARAQRGNAYVIVDETVAEAIAPRLERFTWDLIGDGWQVRRHLVPRNAPHTPNDNIKAVIALHNWLRARHREDPFGRHAVILVGHVPVLRSGKIAPDGHDRMPHATDLIYGDMDGRWTLLRRGEALDSQVPDDFIEMQIGRIDFVPVSDGDKQREISLLRDYFDKNHHWRMGYHGDIRESYGQTDHLLVERAGLRNIVGPPHVTEGGHHDVGEEKAWLWGVDFGDWDGSRYAADYANKAIFGINFGSHKQKIDTPFNGMTAFLAQPWYPVAVGWGARPAWWLHHMALGGTIGDVHMRTVNNGRASEPYRESMEYFPAGKYRMRNGVWVNLLGDPTLRAFPLTPPKQVLQAPVAQGVKLSWQASSHTDTLGYHVYRAGAAEAAFIRLTGTDPITDLDYIDTDPQADTRYMVRAYGYKDVYAGSFYTYSQGAFSAKTPLPESELSISTTLGHAVRLPDIFMSPEGRAIHAIIEEPVLGQLTRDAAGWVYSPPAGFEGVARLRYSVSQEGQTTQKELKVTVGP